MFKQITRTFYHPYLRIYQAVKTLNRYGHRLSNKKRYSVDLNGKALPWYTYPTIHYLDQLDLSNKKIFEWGSGYSSIYFSERAKQVFSVESNEEWHKDISRKKIKNHVLTLANGKEYIENIKKHQSQFDIIVIDGILRTECVNIATDYLNKGGIIILDNSDRYPDDSKFLRDKGLIQIDFHGFGPGVRHTWTTSIFLNRDFDFQPLTQQPLHPLGPGEVK